jgi:hypothetical protein
VLHAAPLLGDVTRLSCVDEDLLYPSSLRSLGDLTTSFDVPGDGEEGASDLAISCTWPQLSSDGCIRFPR